VAESDAAHPQHLAELGLVWKLGAVRPGAVGNECAERLLGLPRDPYELTNGAALVRAAPLGVPGGVLALAAYGIVLWAQSVAPLAMVSALRENSLAKGDALATARIAGIMAAKKTPELVPLCHPIAVSGVKVELAVTDDGVEIEARVKTADRTGVEMEALTAVSVAGLTLVDMVKAVDPAARITDVQVEEKLGGKTGEWHR
jgi:cyclic pyranopterin phosphate synthase